jgi:hypothetical protein
VDCERDDEIVVFVRVGDIFDESDCEVVGELVIGDVIVEKIEIGEEVCVEIDEFDDVFDESVVVGVGTVGGVVGGGRDGSGISKISTTLEYPLEPNPPPKNILFVDDVDASPPQG